jgi:hypothetical protein
MEPIVDTATPETGKAPYTPVSNVAYEKLLTEYRGFVKQSAESIIKRAEIIYEAEAKLGKNAISYTFTRFCKELGYDNPKHSNVKKMLVIGKRASRFYPVLDRVSDNSTTIYKLATLDDADFQRVTEDERFTSKMTAKDLDAICPPKPKKPRKGKGGSKAATHVVAEPEAGTPIPAELMGEPVGTTPEWHQRAAAIDEHDASDIKLDLADLEDDEKLDYHDRLEALNDDFSGRVSMQVTGDLALLLEERERQES